MLKKIIPAIALVGLILSLAACGGPEKNANVPTKPTPNVSTTVTPKVSSSPVVGTPSTVTMSPTAPSDDVTTEPGVPAPTTAVATSQPTPTVTLITTPKDNTEAAVGTFAQEYMKTADLAKIDLDDFSAKIEAATEGMDLAEVNPNDPPEKIFEGIYPAQLKSVHLLTERYNPLAQYFDYSNSSVAEQTMVNLVTMALVSMHDLKDESPAPVREYGIDFAMIEVDGNTANISPGGMMGSPLGTINTPLIKTADGWKIDSHAWYPEALKFVNENSVPPSGPEG